MNSMELNNISSYLDLMLLDPVITLKETLEGCQVACHHLSSVFVKPCYLHQAAKVLRNELI